jgi:hypothetical protein
MEIRCVGKVSPVTTGSPAKAQCGTFVNGSENPMAMVRWLAVGVLGFVAYRAWQRRQARTLESSQPDEGARTPPHGDPVLVGETLEVGPVPAAGMQSSRGFGEP